MTIDNLGSRKKVRHAVIDTSGVPRITIEDMKEIEAIRIRAFFKAATAKLDDLTESNILEAYEGDLDAAAEALDITCEFEGAVFKALRDKLVNDAMDQADQEDSGRYVDLEDLISP